MRYKPRITLLYGTFLVITPSAYAVPGDSIDNEDTAAAKYIAQGNFTQNPYLGFPSLAEHNPATESQVAKQSNAQKWFNDGTWNVLAEAGYMDVNGASNYAYGANVFAQTGMIAGFSLGGLLTVINPIASSAMNPSNPSSQAQTLPIQQQITPQELFGEYQYQHLLQADIGWIGINNSPWLTYYQNNSMNLVTYQGATFNINPGSGFLLTALAFNQAQLVGENGFSNQTMYNQSFDHGTGTANVGSQSTSGTVALGTSWSLPSDWLTSRLWAYKFSGYTDMLYTDSAIKLKSTDQLSFNLAAQGALQRGSSVNILNSNGYGNNIQSNMLGMQLGMNYNLFGLLLGYNNIWGPADAYENGGLISPYTYQYANDPLFTTSRLMGMIEKSAGQAYKIAPSLNLLDGNLSITPSYAYYATTSSLVAPSSEWDMLVNYTPPQIKGLIGYAGYGYIVQPELNGGNTYQVQIILSYLY